MKIYKIFTLIFLCIFIFMNNAHSENATWTGAVSTAWNNTSNWNHSIVPGYNDSVTIGAKPYNPTLNDTLTLKRFKIIGGTLNLNGKSLTINVNSEFSGGTITNGQVITRGGFTYFQGTIFNCPVDARTGQVQLNGGKYNYPVYIEQNGTVTGPGSGNNVFNDSVTIRNTGSGYLRMATSQPDTFNTTATFFNSGYYNLQISYTASTVFNGDVYMSNTNIGGISTNTNGTGTTSLANGKTLKMSSTGFTNGTLLLRNFYQHGTSAPDSIVLGTSATLNIIGSTFESTQDFTAPSVLSKTSTYAAATFRKTANTGNYWDGGNTFNGTTNIYCNSSTMAGYSLSIQQANIFNGDANFYTTTGVIQVINSGITEMKGNCSINNSLITFNNGNGKLKFTGSNEQTLSGSAAYTFGHVIIDKGSGSVTSNQNAYIDSVFTFINGNFIVSSGDSIVFKKPSSNSGASFNSHIVGKVTKIGNTSFVFPVGTINRYMPFGISAPSSITESLSLDFINAGQTLSNTKDTSILRISKSEYWHLAHNVGTSSINVTVSWDENSKDIGSTDVMILTGLNSSNQWKNLGASSIQTNLTNGTISSNITSVYQYYTTAILINSKQFVFNNYNLNNYALIGDSILFQDSIYIDGKSIYNKYISANIFANDSLINANGSASINQFENINNLINNINCLKDTTLSNLQLLGDTISPGIYAIESQVINRKLYFLDTVGTYIIKIQNSLTFDSLGAVISTNRNNKNIFWIVDTLNFSNLNEMNGVILSKSKIILNKLAYGHISCYSLKNIKTIGLDPLSIGKYTFMKPNWLPATPFLCPAYLAPDCQNRVMNPGFSDLIFQPWSINHDNTTVQNSSVCSWARTTDGTSDFFTNVAATASNCSIPTNYFGTQAENGLYRNTLNNNKGYMGIYTSSVGTINGIPIDGREYISGNLIAPLTLGKYYCEFYVSNVNTSYSPYSIKEIGMYLSASSPINYTNLNFGVINQTPQVKFNTYQYLESNPRTWMRVSDCFSTSGGESFVTIGNFKDNASTSYHSLLSTPYPVKQSYYYIDDVSVMPFVVKAGIDQSVACNSSIDIGETNCLSGIGGIDIGQFTYSWSFVSGNASIGLLTSSNSMIAHLQNNNSTNSNVINVYQVTLTTESGCTTTDQVSITFNSCCDLHFTSTTIPTCNLGNSGSISINIISTISNPPYSITLVNPQGGITNYSTSNTTYSFPNLSSGTYTITIRDNINCTFSNFVTINNNTNVVTSIQVDGSIYECSADDVYHITNPVTGGNYNHWEAAWVNGTVFLVGTGTSATITNTNTLGQTFTITFYSNYGTYCPISGTFTSYACCEGSTNVNTGNTNVTFTDVKASDLMTLLGAPYVTQLIGNPYQISLNSTGNFSVGFDRIAINGTFTVDRNLDIYYANIIMGPDARIVINSGYNLNLDEKTYIHSCGEYMWNGIQITNGGNLFTGPYVYIEDAQNAIVSQSGSFYIINKSVFNKNYTSLKVDPSIDNRSIIVGATFTSVEKVCDPILLYNISSSPDENIKLPPYFNQRSKIGVSVYDVTASSVINSGLEIGEVEASFSTNYGGINCGNTVNPCYPNIFHNLDYGIFATRSDLKVINNEFSKIDDANNLISTSGTKGSAIISTSDDTHQRNLVVGDYFLNNHNQNIAANKFTDCKRGVVAWNTVAADVRYNTFTRISLLGTDLAYTKDLLFTVRNNIYYTCNRGIQLLNIYDDPSNGILQLQADIEDNTYSFSGTLPAGATYLKAFISVFNTPQTRTIPMLIAGNGGNYVDIGIRLSNLDGINNSIDVSNNTIHYNPTGKYGIRLNGSSSISIRENLFTKNGTAPLNSRPFGITLETSNDIYNESNTILNSGTGIRVLNSSMPNSFQCNLMQNNFDGIGLVNSNVGVQGTSSRPSDNQWVSNNNYDVNADNLSAQNDWWVRNISFGSPYAASNQNYPLFTAIALMQQVTVSPIPQINCNNPCIDPRICRLGYYISIIKGEGDYSNLDQETEFIIKNVVYSALMADANYYNQGTADDNLVLAFKDSMEAANSGKLYLVDSLLKAQDTVAAKIINDNISPDFNGDYNQKILNQIYTDTWARGLYTLSADQVSILESIAYQNPVYGGTAVYGARVMLDLEIEDDITTGARNAYAKPIQTKTQKINNDNILLTIYPVPVDNELFIESKSLLNGQLIIINQLGQEVYTQQIKNINRLKINTESFNAGIYQVRFNSIDNLVIVKNFIVSR